MSLPGVSSLKEKRRIIKSLIAKLKNKYNISIAEVDNNDIHRKATIGAAIVSNNSSFGNQVIAKVVDSINMNSDVVIIDYQTENY